MRHRVFGKLYNIDKGHRKALLRNLADELIVHGKVETTVAKAKALRPYVEKLITKAAKDASFTSIKRVSVRLQTNDASKKLFKEVAPSFVDTKGGYTRIVRIGNRKGDMAEMARIELINKVVRKEVKKPDLKEKKVKTVENNKDKE